MRDFLTVFSYTFYENLRKKAFIISTTIILILTVILLNIPALINYIDQNKKASVMSSTSNQNHTKEPIKKKGTVFIVDPKGFLKDDLDQFKQAFTQYDFTFIEEDKVDSTKEQIKIDKNLALVVVDDKAGVPYLNYWVKQYGSSLNPDDFSRTLKGLFSSRLLKTANVPDDITAMALSEVSFDVNELGKGMMKGYVASILITMLLFFAIYFFGYGVAMSVASEKTSRIMEIILTSTKPSKIILGKTAAMGALGLCQFGALVSLAALTYKISFPKNFTMFGQSIDFSSFTPVSIIMVFIYFILGYSLYALLNAVAGATVSKAEDLNSAMMPISLITMVSFYMAYGSFMSPDGALSIVSSLIPFSAAFSMPSRILATDVPIWQIATSLAALTITIVLIAWISIRLYSRAVLHYGKRLNLNDIMKITQ
jgi:ABC-2 type transport system permease protein